MSKRFPGDVTFRAELESLEESYGSDRYVEPDVRRAALEEAGGRCVHCGSDNDLEFDHVIPHSRGGSSGLENIQVLCRPCNRLKGVRDHPPADRFGMEWRPTRRPGDVTFKPLPVKAGARARRRPLENEVLGLRRRG